MGMGEMALVMGFNEGEGVGGGNGVF